MESCGKSCTSASSGRPLGYHSLPAFLKFPASSFFFVSTEITGSRRRRNEAAVALMCSNCSLRSGCAAPSCLLRTACRRTPSARHLETRNDGCRKPDAHHQRRRSPRLRARPHVQGDPLRVQREEAPLARRGSAARGRQQVAQTVCSEHYYGGNTGHWIEDVLSDGTIIVLEDDSVWRVDSLDTIHTSIWLPVTNITIVSQSGHYLLVKCEHRRSGQSLPAAMK